MKRLMIATLLLWAAPAAAQQAPPTACDLTVAAYRDLNNEANARLTAVTAQAQLLDARVKELQGQLDKRKAEDDEAKKKGAEAPVLPPKK